MKGQYLPVVYQAIFSPPRARIRELPDQGVEQALVRDQEGVDEVADHDPAHKVGHEHQGLVELGLALAVDVADDDGQAHGQDDVQHDEGQVIQNGVAEDHGEDAEVEEVAEVVEAHPLAAQQIGQKSLTAGDLVILERDDESEHGQVAEEHIPDGSGERQDRQLGVVPGPPRLALARQPGRRRRFLDLCHLLRFYHGDRSFPS